MKSQIVIGGCSFSEKKGNNPNPLWIPWSDMVYKNFDGKNQVVTNTAQSSAGQLLISEKVINEIINYNGKTSLVILQWSAIGRAYYNKDADYLTQLTKAVKYKELHTLIDSREFLNELNEGEVTDAFTYLPNEFYKSSLLRIYLTHEFLKSKGIPYFSFWGWQQITKKQNELWKIIELVHDDNFFREGKYGGMSEYCISKLGKDRAILKGDFHPTTESHQLWYNDIIYPMLIKKGFVPNKII